MLAIYGGKKVIRKAIKYNHPQLNLDKISITNELISFSGKGLVEDMEAVFEKKYGFKFSVACNSGTSAIFSMFYAAGLKKGDKVLVHSYTFFACALPLFMLGCEPILVDTDENGNVNVFDLNKKFEKDVKALVITHLWGIPSDMDGVNSFVSKYKLMLFEDCSHAHGATHKGKFLGSFGDAAAWSLGAKKNITGGQGGIMATNSRKIYEAALILGHSHELGKKDITLPEFVKYKITGTGLNLRIHPFSAYLIQLQLRNYNCILKEKQRNADYMIKELSNIKGLKLPNVSLESQASWYAFPILYDKCSFGDLSRDDFVRALQAEGALEIDYPVSTCPLDSFPIFNERFEHLFSDNQKLKINEIPNAWDYHRKIIKMPVFYGKNGHKYTKKYIECIKKVSNNYQKLL